jgi:hypothetical protein
MKQCLMRGTTYFSANSYCPVRGLKPDWLFSKPASVQGILYVAQIMIGAVVTACG